MSSVAVVIGALSVKSLFDPKIRIIFLAINYNIRFGAQKNSLGETVL